MFTQYAPMAKLAVAVTANLGIAKIVGDVVRNNVTVTSTMQAITVKAGTFVVTSMICEQAAKHVSETVDNVTAWLDKKKEEVDETIEKADSRDDTGDDDDMLRSVS